MFTHSVQKHQLCSQRQKEKCYCVKFFSKITPLTVCQVVKKYAISPEYK